MAMHLLYSTEYYFLCFSPSVSVQYQRNIPIAHEPWHPALTPPIYLQHSGHTSPHRWDRHTHTHTGKAVDVLMVYSESPPQPPEFSLISEVLFLSARYLHFLFECLFHFISLLHHSCVASFRQAVCVCLPCVSVYAYRVCVISHVQSACRSSSESRAQSSVSTREDQRIFPRIHQCGVQRQGHDCTLTPPPWPLQLWPRTLS